MPDKTMRSFRQVNIDVIYYLEYRNKNLTRRFCVDKTRFEKRYLHIIIPMQYLYDEIKPVVWAIICQQHEILCFQRISLGFSCMNKINCRNWRDDKKPTRPKQISNNRVSRNWLGFQETNHGVGRPLGNSRLHSWV